jgi:uncharacterized protein with von Willebrand factor type A (vWA) domain
VNAALRRVAGFAHTLRGAGFAVGRAETLDAARLLASPLAERPERLRAALRALFASNAVEYRRFDEVFDAFWRGRGAKSAALKASGAQAAAQGRTPGGGAGGERGLPEGAGAGAPAESAPGRQRGASTQDVLSTKDFAGLAEAERARTLALAERLARAMCLRLKRRERARRRGRPLDLRRTIRRCVARGGEPLDLSFRKPHRRPLKLVALLDASGSMELYVSLFTRFLHAVAQTFRRSDAFLFHTRLAHVSAALAERHPQRALDRLSLMAAGIGGGTKIGDCLAEFDRRHARRALNARACLMIFSDGYDTGEPAVLEAAMRRLRRRTRRIVWLDPLTGREGFAPVARGLKTALPFVDLFAPAHDLASLAALEPYLARICR